VRTQTDTRQITLNGVTVPIEVSHIGQYLPYYKPAFPTESRSEYEHTEVESLRTYVGKGDSVVIIGGGLGVTAVVASEETDGKVTVFEQSKSAYRILNSTIESNGCDDNIETQLIAVGEPGEASLTNTTPSNIDTIRPSELPPADVYEIDCEGAEIAILEKMHVKPHTLLVETHDNHDTVCEILTNLGYQIVEVVNNGPEQMPSLFHLSNTHIRAQLSK
jgi:hypothetical protein